MNFILFSFCLFPLQAFVEHKTTTCSAKLVSTNLFVFNNACPGERRMYEPVAIATPLC